jgi:3-oxoacyl-[acyl-carrier protein] reductase
VEKKRVLITGASRGIGAAIAIKLAQQGYDVSIHYHSNTTAAENVLKKVSEHSNASQLLQFDINDRKTTRNVLEHDLKNNGSFYGVVCNAGINDDDAFPALTETQWDNVVHTNLDGFYNVLHPLIMPMIRTRKGGRIITMSSVSGLVGNRGQVNYSAAKAGIIGATKALAIELAKRKITVNCIAPGIIETDMIEEIHADEAKKMIPMGHFGKTDDIASAVNFLMSDSASYITRQVLSINGGMC